MGQGQQFGNHPRHALKLRPSGHLARRTMALLRLGHAGGNGRNGHLARAHHTGRTGWCGEPRGTHQHAGQRDVPHLPSQWRPVFLQRWPSRTGRTGHLHRPAQRLRRTSGAARFNCAGRGIGLSPIPSRLSSQLAGRRLRHDVRGGVQPRLLLIQPRRRTGLGSHLLV